MRAVCLRRGSVGLDDFSPQALSDPESLAVAGRLTVIADGNPDSNALHPVSVELELAGGSTVACDVGEVLGSPANPLPRAAARGKFMACCTALPAAGAALWEAVRALDTAAAAGALGALTAK